MQLSGKLGMVMQLSGKLGTVMQLTTEWQTWYGHATVWQTWYSHATDYWVANLVWSCNWVANLVRSCNWLLSGKLGMVMQLCGKLGMQQHYFVGVITGSHWTYLLITIRHNLTVVWYNQQVLHCHILSAARTYWLNQLKGLPRCITMTPSPCPHHAQLASHTWPLPTAAHSPNPIFVEKIGDTVSIMCMLQRHPQPLAEASSGEGVVGQVPIWHVFDVDNQVP